MQRSKLMKNFRKMSAKEIWKLFIGGSQSQTGDNISNNDLKIYFEKN